MKTRELLSVCFCLLIMTEVGLNLDFYQSTVHPLDLIAESLDEVIGSSCPANPDASDCNKTKFWHDDGNHATKQEPCWLYPTESTNFLRIKNDLDTMETALDKLSGLPTDTSAYSTGMMDISSRASLIKENLTDARGFMYGSATNVFFTLVWVAGAVGFAGMWARQWDAIWRSWLPTKNMLVLAVLAIITKPRTVAFY